MKTRREAVKEWTCPHHPDGRPAIAGQGYEAEDVDIDDELLPATFAALHALRALAGAEPMAQVFEDAWVELGLCCDGHTWKVVGYETREVSPFEELLLDIPQPLMPESSILLDELSKPTAHALVRVPLIRGDT